ncbi:MAG: hypothetical protein P8075_05190 [Deltaproteobacteria bacterium]
MQDQILSRVNIGLCKSFFLSASDKSSAKKGYRKAIPLIVSSVAYDISLIQ